MIIAEAPASPGQRILWLMNHYNAGNGRLNYPLLLRLRGPLDTGQLQHAIDTVIRRHESLRTTFGRSRGLLTQFIHEPRSQAITVKQCGPPSVPEPSEVVQAEVRSPIDPRSAPLRVTLWALAPDEHILCINAHHLVTDAWSCRVVLEELLQLLSRHPDLPRPGWQYRHFVQWQRRRATMERQKADREYWNRQLAGTRAPGLAYRAGQPPAAGAPCAETIQLDLGSEDWGRIRKTARAEQTTPFTVMLSIYYLLLHRESGDTDLAVSSPFANRVRPEVMRTVGFFANMLVLRTRLRNGSTFAHLIRNTSSTVNAALAHQAFAHFLPSAGPREDAGRRVENIVFQMLPELPPPARVGDLELSILPPGIDSRFDLEFSALPHHGGLRVLIQCSPSLPGGVGQRLAAGLGSVIGKLAAGPGFPV